MIRRRLSVARDLTAEHVKQIDEAWNTQISVLPDHVPLMQSIEDLHKAKNVVMVSNTATPEAIVDYATPHYYNALRPWIGSAQVNVKLNVDGTLTEGSAQVESTTLQGVLDFVPAKDLFGIAPAPGKEKDALGAPEGPDIAFDQLELTIKQEDYRRIHTSYTGNGMDCKPQDGGVKKPCAERIEMPGAASEKQDPEKTVEVTGKIILPSLALTAAKDKSAAPS
jgi:hypothetical protein